MRFWILSVIFALLGLATFEIEMKWAIREQERRGAWALVLAERLPRFCSWTEGAKVTVLDSAEEKKLLKSTLENLRDAWRYA